MGIKNEQSFGEYAEMLRRRKGKSQREVAKAIGISAQFYSEVEKGRRTPFTPERLELLRKYLELDKTEADMLFNKAAEGRKVAEFDFSGYIIQRDYVISALRVAQELNADEEDWQRFLDDLQQRKE